jgi:hypothetical protein
MKLHLLIAVASLSVVSVAWAGTYAPVDDPAAFVQSVNWCQFAPVNCTATVAAPNPPDPSAAWVSTPSGKTGYAGLFYDSHSFSVTPDPSGMGLINSFYGAATVTLDDVSATFDAPTDGAGAYIESSYVGNVVVTVQPFNDVYNFLPYFQWLVNFDGTPGASLFVGATSSESEVAGVIFDVSDATTGNTVPFSMGTLEFDQVPEPGSIALVAPMLLGLGVMLRKRARKS